MTDTEQIQFDRDFDTFLGRPEGFLFISTDEDTIAEAVKLLREFTRNRIEKSGAMLSISAFEITLNTLIELGALKPISVKEGRRCQQR